MNIEEYATVLQDISKYTSADADYPKRLFEAKMSLSLMVDKVYANHGKYKHIPTLEEPIWDPENHVPKKKLETIVELGQILEMLRYQDEIIQRQALDLGRTSVQGRVIQQNYIKVLEKYQEQNEYVKQLINEKK